MRWSSLFVLFSVLSLPVEASTCGGRLVNPVTDICWMCIFPIAIAGAVIPAGQAWNHDLPPPPLCSCPAPPPIFVRPGFGVAFWEPARWVEVVREPFCFPSFGGSVGGGLSGSVWGGTNSSSDEEGNKAFYHSHYFSAPILSWVGSTLSSVCSVTLDADMMFMSEIDPLWNDDSTSMLLNPEALLFNNPVAILACAADAVSATTTNFGLDALFWCAGAQGQAYPLNGNHATHVGGVDSSINIMQKTTMLMHRLGMEMDSSSPLAMCMDVPQPVMRKNQYKFHMIYPIPRPFWAYGFGANSYWAAGAEFPVRGEDFNYMLFKKRQCCAL